MPRSLLVALLAFMANSHVAFSTAPAAQPNVLWILTDDQRYDSIQAFNRMLHDRDHSELGYVESPNVDRLAAMGTTFINTYCHAPGCAPSRASMHYGRYPFRSGVYEFEYHNNNAEHCRPTLPEQMVSLGYQTMHVGKLGVRIRTLVKGRPRPHPIYQTDIDSRFLREKGLTDWGKGWMYLTEDNQLDFYKFDGTTPGTPMKNIEFLVTEDGKFEHTNPQLEELAGFQGQSQRVDEKYDLLRHYNKKKPKAYGSGMAIGGVSPRSAGKTRDGYYASVFCDYLQSADQPFAVGSETFPGVDSSKPLFCHIGFDFPHTPVLPPADYRARFQQHTYKVPEFDPRERQTMAKQLRKQNDQGYSDHLPDEDKQSMTQDYYAFCAYGDSLVGQSVDAFVEYSEQQGRPWMVVYVCGDHGWKLNDHGSVSKFTPWDIDCHNPMIVVSSDKQAYPPGKVVREFTEFVDVAPTVLSAAGADLDASRFAYLDGCDLAEVASGNARRRDYVIGECHAVTGPRAYIRTKDYVFSMQTRPDKRRGKQMNWARNASYAELDPALYHTASDPHEVKNLAFDKQYEAVAQKLKTKLLRIALGDGRVEVAWGPKADGVQVFRNNFAPGSHDGVLDL